MNTDRRGALSKFYREEFERHIEHLQATGILNEGRSEAVSRALMTRLEDVCLLASFPAVAETVLQSFETLTGLSRLDLNHRQRH
jgi:hypothetical protein